MSEMSIQSRWAAANLSSYRHARYIVFGYSDGSFVDALIEAVDSDSMFIIYEPDLSVNIDFFADERIKITHDLSKFYNFLYDSVPLEYVNGSILCCIPSYNNFFPNEYAAFESLVHEVIILKTQDKKVIHNKGRKLSFAHIHSLKYIEQGSSLLELAECYNPNIPIIIAGAGPSLNNDIQAIKEFHEKAYVICVDSALPVLLLHNIIPDLYISVDVLKNPSNFTDERIRNIPAVLVSGSLPMILENRTAPSYFYDDGNKFIKEFLKLLPHEYPTVSSGGSVTNQALNIALYLHAKTIIVTGFDLGYTNNLGHAFGTVYDIYNEINGTNNHPVKSNNGKTVYSDQSFDLYRASAEHMIRHADYPVCIINTALEGSYIQGMEVMPMQNAVLTYCTTPYHISHKFQSVCATKYIDYLSSVINAQTSYISTLTKFCTAKCDDTFETVNKFDLFLNELSSSPEFEPIYSLAYLKISDSLLSLYKKEAPTVTIRKYKEIFSLLLDASNEILAYEREISTS